MSSIVSDGDTVSGLPLHVMISVDKTLVLLAAHLADILFCTVKPAVRDRTTMTPGFRSGIAVLNCLRLKWNMTGLVKSCPRSNVSTLVSIKTQASNRRPDIRINRGLYFHQGGLLKALAPDNGKLFVSIGNFAIRISCRKEVAMEEEQR